MLRLYERRRSTASTVRETHHRTACVAASVVGYGHAGHRPLRHSAIRTSRNSRHKWEHQAAINRGTIVPLREIVVKDHRETITRAVRESELACANMGPEDAVPGKFVQSHAPVGRDADRVRDVRQVRERVVDVVDAIPVANEPRVDDVTIRGKAVLVLQASASAMVHVDRKLGAAEVATNPSSPSQRKAEIGHEPKKAVYLVIRIDRGKLVGADIPNVEVAAGRTRRRRDVRGGYVSHCGPGTLQRLCERRSGSRIQVAEFLIELEKGSGPRCSGWTCWSPCRCW